MLKTPHSPHGPVLAFEEPNILVVEGNLHSTCLSLFSLIYEITSGTREGSEWALGDHHLRGHRASVFFSNRLCWEDVGMFVLSTRLATKPFQVNPTFTDNPNLAK